MTQTHVIAHLNQPTIAGKTLVLHPDAELKHAPLPIPVTATGHGPVGRIVHLTRIGDQITAELELDDPDQHQGLRPVPYVTIHQVQLSDDDETLMTRWRLDSVHLVEPETYPWVEGEGHDGR